MILLRSNFQPNSLFTAPCVFAMFDKNMCKKKKQLPQKMQIMINTIIIDV